MKADEAKAALEFMRRVQLSGTEVDAWLAVCHALRYVVEDAEMAKTAQEIHEALQDSPEYKFGGGDE